MQFIGQFFTGLLFDGGVTNTYNSPHATISAVCLINQGGDHRRSTAIIGFKKTEPVDLLGYTFQNKVYVLLLRLRRICSQC